MLEHFNAFFNSYFVSDKQMINDGMFKRLFSSMINLYL